MGTSTGQLRSLKLSLRQILFSPSYCIHCLVSYREGLGRSRFIVGISNILKFGVYRAYIERDTAIQKLQNSLRNIRTSGRCVRQAIHLLENFEVYE